MSRFNIPSRKRVQVSPADPHPRVFRAKAVLSLGLILLVPTQHLWAHSAQPQIQPQTKPIPVSKNTQTQQTPSPNSPEQNYKPIDPFKKPFEFFTPKYSKTLTSVSPKAGAGPNPALRLLQNAEHLLKIWVADKSRTFDAEGRPWSKIPDFERILKKFRPQLTRQAGYLLFVLSNFSASHFRRAAHFAALFLPTPQETLYLLPYAPYEPDFGIRREALSRMIPFLDRHLNPKTPDGQRAPYYIFDPIPFLNLCRASWVPDRILAFKVLTVLARYRPKDAAVGLRRIRPWIQKSLEDKSPYLQKAAKALIRTLEANPTAGPLEDISDCMSRLDLAIDRELPRVFLQGGLCEIFSPDTEPMKALAKEGLAWIQSGKVGFVDTVRIVGSKYKRSTRGLRLRKVPKPLQVFGLQEGDCITAINGFPIRNHQDLAKTLKERLRHLPTSITVEWVGDKGHEKARRYAIYKKDPTWRRFHLRWRPELKTYFARLKQK